MKKVLLTVISAVILSQSVLCDTRLIGALDLMDAWQFNFNASHWVEQGNLNVGAPMYGEESIVIESLSPQMQGLDWIQCAYGSKSYTDDVVASFVVKQTADVYIAHNDAIVQKPLWLDKYIKTSYKLTNSKSENFTLYTRRFQGGTTVALGNNGSTKESMYLVAVGSAEVLATAQKPSGKLFDITAMGAKGDGKSINTEIIQRAIDSASKQGGVVYIGSGIFVTGTVQLKDNVTLFVEQGAILRGSVNHSDYPQIQCALPSFRGKENYQLIYAERAKNVTITGGGIIDGYSLFEGYPWKGRNNEHERPRLIRMVECDNVVIKDMTLIRSANWTQYYEGCKNLTIENITVRCYTGTNNQDGIDVSGCKNVVIKNFNGICGDDVICIKSLSMLDGDNIVVDGVRSRYANCNIVKIGTETHGAVRNVEVRNVEGWARYALAIQSVDGAVVENILYENIKLHNCSAPFMVRLGNRGRNFEGGPATPAVAQMRNITFRNISNTDITYAMDRGGPGVGVPIAGIKNHPIENVTIENCDLLFFGSLNDTDYVYRDIPENDNKYPEFHMFGPCPAYGLYFRHISGLKVKNVNVSVRYHDVRPAIVLEDVKGYTMDGVNVDKFDKTTPEAIWDKSKK